MIAAWILLFDDFKKVFTGIIVGSAKVSRKDKCGHYAWKAIVN